MNKYTFSVIIPAHNEENYIARCIHSIKIAAKHYGGNTEIIVVCNRCTDRTADIAVSCGAKVLYNETRCIASVRNTGIASANGDIIVTIDADNRMTRGTLKEIAYKISTGKYIGGGSPIKFERHSFALICNENLCKFAFRITGLYCGIFWAEKKTFQAIEGFSELKAMEDAATAKKLKQYGKIFGKKYTTLKKNFLINSTRKFDDMGDWLYFKLMLKNVDTLLKAAFGDRRKLDILLDEMFYDYNDKNGENKK